MSYILDALKRSEQERQQGQVPGFVDSSAILHTSSRRKSSWLFWGLVLVVVNAAALFYIYQQVLVSERKESRLGSNSVEQPASTMTLPRQDNTQFEGPAVNTMAPQPVTLPKVSKLAESREHITVPVAERNLGTAKNARADNVLLADTIARLEGGAGEPAYLKQQGIEVHNVIHPRGKQEPIPSEDTYSSLAPGSVVVASAPLDAKPQAIAEPAIPTTLYPDVALLTELENAFQRSVPKLVFNSHIYSDQPRARRVMINNIYLREGQVFSGIEVKEIGEHSIVFEKQGRLFRLPVMRDWLG